MMDKSGEEKDGNLGGSICRYLNALSCPKSSLFQLIQAVLKNLRKSEGSRSLVAAESYKLGTYVGNQIFFLSFINPLQAYLS